MPRESPNRKSDDLQSFSCVQVTSGMPKVTPRIPQQAFENLHPQPSGHAAGGVPPRGGDLVLQMYAHVKTHRRLQHEREMRLSKAARRRQAKQEPLSFILSPGRLNREWHGDHSNTSPGLGADVTLEDSSHANTEVVTDPNNEMMESVGLTDAGELSINCETSPAEISKSNADLQTSFSDSESTPGHVEEFDLISGKKNNSGSLTSLIGSRVNSRRDEAEDTDQRHRIQFPHTATPRSVVGESRVKIHWDSVKPGAVVPAPVSVVTFDGGLFT